MPPSRKRKAAAVRDWVETTQDDVRDDPSLLPQAPLWWPHLFDSKGALGEFPFPVPRALAILNAAACEVCGLGGVSGAPRALGLKFGLWAHDKCIGDVGGILVDRRDVDAGRLELYDAAGGHTHAKSMYSKRGGAWTLRLVCDAHALVPSCHTLQGLAGLTLAQATKAG